MKTPLHINPETSEIEDADRHALGVIYFRNDAQLVGAYLGIHNDLVATNADLVAALREIALVWKNKGIGDTILSPEECCEEMADMADEALAKEQAL